MRVRSSTRLTRPIRSPSTSTVPTVGCISAPARRSSVVLPAPLGPSTTHRSSSSTAQSTSASRVELPRRTADARHPDHDVGQVGASVRCGHALYPGRSCRSSPWVPMSRTEGSGSPSPPRAPTRSRCASSTDPTAGLAERRVALTERTFGVWHGHVPGVGAGQRYGYRVHGPYRPWTGVRANPAKILVDPYARQIVGRVTDLEAARGWVDDPMTRRRQHGRLARARAAVGGHRRPTSSPPSRGRTCRGRRR